MDVKRMSTQSVLGQGPLTFEDVLRDPVNLNYYKKFCMQELSTENLLFWLEVQEYKAIQAIEYRKFSARKLWRKYLKVDAPCEISITPKMREKIQNEMEDPMPETYDQVQEHVALSMKMDSFPRFVSSPFYEQLVELKFDERKVVTVDDFDLYRFLGAGGFGMVLLTRKKDNGSFFAMKVIDKRILISQNQVHSIFREKEVLASCEHPFIVCLKYALQTLDHLLIVLDFIKGGNMYSDLMRGPYTHDRAKYYAAEIVLAINHLHEMDILYRDLKPDNVLLSLDGHVKLADMGAARGVAEDGNIQGETGSSSKTAKAAKEGDPARARRMTITGTHGYRAPEVYERDYGKAADWWNVGVVIVEMMTGENPLRGDNRRESEYLTKHKDVTLPGYLNEDACSIILAFLQKDASKRLGCYGNGLKEIQSHPFFTGLDWEKLTAMAIPPPFEVDLDPEPMEPQRPLTKETNNVDYFCQMVDYLKTSMSMRSTWPLKPEDQKMFEEFDYVSPKVFEEELLSMNQGPVGGLGL